MATALQQQLAAIAANSTHQLDLKAQKARHSKSLLFEPRDASSQSFDTIYQICHEGFIELCALDARFAVYERNIFSEQSKDEDRTRMTAEENEDLDKILEGFLGLVGGRLLLQPAMKAVEWLVRRFRVQEYNTDTVILTFLPYHTSHIFPILLSILPEQLPANFRFLQPYKASLQNPPRSAILSAAVGNQNFFSALNKYTLKVSKAKQHSAILLGFWASITAQAVNGMIDTSRSGRDSVRQQREEDLLLRVLPTLQSALSLKGIPELYLGCCMIITILATKASLEDSALDAMMEAISSSWSAETICDGMMCLAVVAEEKERTALPISVVKAIIASDSAFDQLFSQLDTQRSTKLITGVAMVCAHVAGKKKDPSMVSRVKEMLAADVLPHENTVLVLEKLMGILLRLKRSGGSTEVEAPCYEILASFLHEAEGIDLLHRAAHATGTDLTALQLVPIEQNDGDEMEIDEPKKAQKSSGVADDNAKAEFDNVLNSLPPLPEDAKSFFDIDGDPKAFQSYAAAFQNSISSPSKMERFLTLPQFQPNGTASQLFTFLPRVWSSNTTVAAKVAAISSMSKIVVEMRQKIDISDSQKLIPYVLVALSNESAKVRQASAQLCRDVCALGASTRPGTSPFSKMYGSHSLRYELKREDVRKVLQDILLPSVEDAVLDRDYVKHVFTDIINEKRELDVKKSFKSDLCLFLADHLASPAIPVQLVLLQILSSPAKSTVQAKSQILLPFVQTYLRTPSGDIKSKLDAEGVSAAVMDKAVLSVLSHRSTEEIQMLKDVAAAKLGEREDLVPLAFLRLCQIFPAAKGSQIDIADYLRSLALGSGNASSSSQDEALQALRYLQLPTEILVHFVESLPRVSDQQEQPPAKRRRTSNNESTQLSKVDHTRLQESIRHITLILELVEASHPEKHPQLLRGLFHNLSELHHFKTLLGSELVYTFQILLGCILSIVDEFRSHPGLEVDRTAIRTDLIVDCVRTTSSTQIHNTALLLVSSLARWAPELVLHCVMPLFTFMSTTLLRQSDSFSAHVTDQTVERIVPPLAASLKKKGKSLVVGASELLLSFAAAFEHIPLHRRAGLFKHLVETLGPEETLFAVDAMLVERYPNESTVLSFVADLTNQFSGLIALRTAKQYLELVSDSMKPKRNLSNVLLSFGDKTSEEMVETQRSLLAGLASLLQNLTLRQQLATELEEDNEGSKAIRSTYASLLEHTMQINRELASNTALGTPANSVLLSVLGLMPMKDFIESSAQLMQSGTDQTRQQVFRALEARVVETKSNDSAARQIFLDVLPNCGVFLRKDQPVETRRAAVSCIDQICDKFGKTDRPAVLEVAKVIAGEFALGSDDISLRVISTLCLASMVEVLADEFVPILPNVLTRVLDYLKQNLKSESPNAELLSAGFALLNAVLDHLPWMVGDQYLDLSILLAEEAAFMSPPITHVQELAELVSKQVGPAQLFTALKRTFDKVPQVGVEDNQGMRLHLDIFHKAVQHHTKANITAHARAIFSILYEAFELRRTLFPKQQDEYDWSDMFARVDTIALDVTFKINDATFRPFFMTLVDWATKEIRDADGRVARMTSLYSFSLKLCEQLKSIVTSYASFLLDSAKDVLQDPPLRSAGDAELLDLVLKTLSSSFNHDQDDFWQTPSHFDVVAIPLIQHLQQTSEAALLEQIITTITDLAAATRSQEQLKTINAAIMTHMRSQEAKVRLAAVKCQRSLTDRLAVDWLALLPEMLPIISELHEDDDEKVERETLRWAEEIREVTGEDLDGMLA